MTNETKPTPAKKRGRPPRVATTPQESPSPESKSNSGTPGAAEPEIDTQGVQVIIAKHMVQDHRMTWGEVRVSLGYGMPGHNWEIDGLWERIYQSAIS